MKKQQPPKNNLHRTNTIRRQYNYLRNAEQEYIEYQQQYPRRGFLSIQTLTAQKTFPVANATVEITKDFPSGTYEIDKQMTDISGLIEPVELPALPTAQSLVPGVKDPFTTYDARITHPDFVEVLIRNIPVYENLTTVQIVDMMPRAAANGTQVIEYDINAPVV